MAVPEQTPYKEYTANGVTTSFTVTFQCNSKDRLKVFINGIEQPSADWQFSGGNVVFNVPPVDGSILSIERSTRLKRDTTYSSYDNSFRPEAINQDFDTLWHSAQEIELKNKNIDQKFQDLLDSVAAGNVAGLPAEILARIAADEQLQESVNAEELRAYAAESIRYTKAETYNRTEIDASITAITSGHKAYQTLALAQAAQASLPANTVVEVTNDGANSGTYQWNGTTLTKSAYDPLNQSKLYVADFKDDAGIHARTKLDLLNSGITDQERVDSLLSNGGAINFKTGTTLFNGKPFADIVNLTNLTFSRASTAYVNNENGVFTLTPIDTVRRVNNKGLFLEKAATQLLTQPTDFSNSAWVKMGATAATVAAGAPDLIGSAFDIVESADGSGSSYIQSNVALVAGSNCFSAFLSRGDNRHAQMFIGISSNTYAISIDFDNEKAQVASGALAPVDFGIEKIKTNLYRVWLSVSPSNAVSATAHIRGAGGMTFADRTYTRTTGNVAVRAAWAQVESGSYPTSPIITGGGTRAADSFKIAWLGSNLDDEIAVSYDSTTVKLKRSDLANSQEFDMTLDVGFSWSGKFVSSTYFFPARDPDFFANYKNVDDRASALATQNAVTSAVLNSVLAKLGGGDFSLDNSNSLSVIKPTDNGCTPYLFIDNSSKKYYWHGQFYDTQESLLAESGGVKTGQVISWNATRVSDENLFLSDFNSGVDGFSLVADGSVAQVGGELEFTATASTGTFSRSFRGLGGKALRLSAKYRKGTSVGSRIGASSYNQTLTFSPLVTAGSSANLFLDFSPVVGRQFWIGGGQNGGTLGTSYFDDFKLQEVFPASGFPQGRHTLVIEGVMPSTLPASEQIIYQLDCGGNNNDREYIAVDSAGAVLFVTRYWGVSGIDATQKKTVILGTLSANQVFKIAVSAKNSQIVGAVNGVGGSADATGSVGGSCLRFGRGLTDGTEFLGVLNKVEIYKGAETLKWCIDQTSINTVIPMYQKKPKQILMVGDSWAEDSSTGMGPMLRDLGYDVFSVGVGGSTMEQQRDYALAEPDLLKNSLIIWWDGVPNGHVDGQIELEKSYLQDVLAAAGHTDFIWCRNGQAQVGDTQQADMDAFRLWVSQKYGSSHVYDPNHIYVDYVIKDPDNAGYAADQARLTQQRVPYSLMMPDEAHLVTNIRRTIARDLQKHIFNLASV